LRFVTEIFENQRFEVGWNVVKREITVGIGCRIDCDIAFDINGCERQRFAICLVFHSTIDRDIFSSCFARKLAVFDAGAIFWQIFSEDDIINAVSVNEISEVVELSENCFKGYQNRCSEKQLIALVACRKRRIVLEPHPVFCFKIGKHFCERAAKIPLTNKSCICRRVVCCVGILPPNRNCGDQRNQ